MKSTKKLLSITNLKKYFPIAKSSIFQREQYYVRANEDISIDIYEGETFSLVGESGCGKSTLGRTILQLYNQTAGSTIYYGQKIQEVAPRYVTKLLANPKKYISKWHKMVHKADALDKKVAELEAAGTIKFTDYQERNIARSEEQTYIKFIASILGGLVAIENNEEGLNLLRARYKVAVQVAKDKVKRQNAKNLRSFYHGKMEEETDPKKKEKYEKLYKKYCEVYDHWDVLVDAGRDQRTAYKKEIEAYKSQFVGNPEFDKYEVYFTEGIDLSRLTYNEIRSLRKDLQIIFQDPYSSLNPRMTIGQIIEEGLTTHNMFKHGSRDLKEYILQTMRECGLQDYMLHRYPHQFSGGQRQRICIARALAVQPKFVVCDECVSALDVSIQSQIINLLEELKQKQGLTYLFISHDLSVVKYISDRIGVMYLGNIVELGTTDDIFKDPRHPYTVALLSSIPTTEINDSEKERIILEGNIPSPIKPPEGCKFHTRCFMACEKCKVEPPELKEISPGHFVACHFLDKKVDENGNFLAELFRKAKEKEQVVEEPKAE